MDYKNMTAPCGVPCFECTVFKAKSDPQIRKIMSERIGIPLEKCECPGCRNVNGKCFLFEKNNIFSDGKCFLFGNEKGQCKIYLCTESKGIHNCSECKEFPCDLLHPLADNAAKVPHNTKVFQLCLIKKMGLEKWAKEKAGQVLKTYMGRKWGE